VRAGRVVVAPPCFDDPAGRGQAAEQVLIEAFVAEPAVEGFHDPVRLGLAQRDVVPRHPATVASFEHSAGGHLCTVLADNPHGQATAGRKAPSMNANFPGGRSGTCARHSWASDCQASIHRITQGAGGIHEGEPLGGV